MSSMHIQGDLEDRMIALGYKKCVQRVRFVNEATRERLGKGRLRQNNERNR